MLSSPVFELAQRACAKLGLELAGYIASEETPSAAAIAQALAVAKCMRAHGVPNWPDPTRTLPSKPNNHALTGAVPNSGLIFAIPKSIEIESPAVKQAAQACR